MGRPVSATSKLSLIKKHLKNKKCINTIDAFSMYGVTRLSALIYVLRYDFQWGINSVSATIKDNKGNSINCVEYRLRSTSIPAVKQVPANKTKKKHITDSSIL